MNSKRNLKDIILIIHHFLCLLKSIHTNKFNSMPKKIIKSKLILNFLLLIFLILTPANFLLELFSPLEKITNNFLPNQFKPAISNLSNLNKVYAATDIPGLILANNSFGYSKSISGQVSGTSISIVSNNGTKTNYSSLASALDDTILNQANPIDYVIYFGAAYSLTSTDQEELSKVTTVNAKSLTFISDSTDNLNTSTTNLDPNANQITLPSILNLSVPTVFRNITLAGSSSIYANGNNLAIRSGAFFTGAINLYGGAKQASVANTSIWIGATGSSTFNIYGGSDGGTVTGNTSLTVTNTSGNNLNIYGGGNNTSTVNGNTNVAFNTNSTNGTFQVYGGGQTNTDKITGTVNVDVTGTNGGILTLMGNSATGGAITGDINVGISGISGNTSVNTIYGDGQASPPSLSTTRIIKVTVNSPDYTFSNDINATAYNLATTNGLLATTIMNINATGVKQISAGADGNDNFTNATTSQNTATINLGSSSASSSNQVTLATNLVHNFTSLNILPYNELDLSATGYIYNGGGIQTNASNYQNNYANFGSLNMYEGSGIVDKSQGGISTTPTAGLQPTNILIQVGAWNVAPNTYLKDYYFSNNWSWVNNYAPIISSNFSQLTKATYSQETQNTSGNYTSQSILTWQPLISRGLNINENNLKSTTAIWGSTGSNFQHMMLIIPVSGQTATKINPVEINGYDQQTGLSYIGDYSPTTINGISANQVVCILGNIRQFQINGTNTSTGAGQWNINPSLSSSSGTNGFIGSSLDKNYAYASYFSNSVNGATYNNLAELIYPASSTFGWTVNAQISPASFLTIGTGNYIRHAEVRTPTVGATSSYIDWEWPNHTATSPSTNAVLASNDSPIYNSNTLYTSYVPGGSDGPASQISDSSLSLNYPVTSSISSWMFTNQAGHNWGFFPGSWFDGSDGTSQSGNFLNPTNWNNLISNSGQTGTNFLIYNVKPNDSVTDSGNTTPPPLETSTTNISNPNLSVSQLTAIASTSDVYSALAAYLKPYAQYYDGSNNIVKATEVDITNGTNSITPIVYNSQSQFAADLSNALSTTSNTINNGINYQKLGTKITIKYITADGILFSGTITVVAGSLSANNVTTVTQVVNSIAKDMNTIKGQNAADSNFDNEIAKDLLQLTGATATDATNTDLSSNIKISGWADAGASYMLSDNYTNTQLYNQIISDLSATVISSGTTFNLTFSAPDGMGGTNSQTVQILIIPGTISAQNVTLTMSQVKTILTNNSSATALGTDLMNPITSTGAAGANVSASIASSSATTSLSNATNVFNWLKTLDGSATTTQTTDLTFTTLQYGISTTVSLSVLPAGLLTIKSVPDLNFGIYSTANQPADWTNIPMLNSNGTPVTREDPNIYAQIYDTRSTPATWSLSLSDSGNLFGGNITLIKSSATSSAGISSGQENTNQEQLSTTPSIIFTNTNPQGGNTNTGYETVNIMPVFKLSFASPLLTTTNGWAIDKLTWTLTSAP